MALLLGLLWVMSSAAGFVNGDRSVERPQAQTLIESAAGESLTAGQVVIVKPGDTLWSIARKMQPTGDVRPLVDRIATLNNGYGLISWTSPATSIDGQLSYPVAGVAVALVYLRNKK